MLLPMWHLECFPCVLHDKWDKIFLPKMQSPVESNGQDMLSWGIFSWFSGSNMGPWICKARALSPSYVPVPCFSKTVSHYVVHAGLELPI
jgi:hypothetical protein